MDYLYIDADEDHAALQFHEKKGDIVKAENGVKNNGLPAKLIYIYEGKENESFQNSRRVYDYLEENYELSKVKKYI